MLDRWTGYACMSAGWLIVASVVLIASNILAGSFGPSTRGGLALIAKIGLFSSAATFTALVLCIMTYVQVRGWMIGLMMVTLFAGIVTAVTRSNTVPLDTE